MKKEKLNSKKELKFISNSEEQTKKIAKDLPKNLKGGRTICLYGDLGSGKTTFIQGLARGLGVKERIISPTFILHRSYRAKKFGISKLHHIDLYRIHGVEGVTALGLEELFLEERSVMAIEWAEKIEDLLPQRRIDIFFKYTDKNKREIKIRYESSKS